MRYRDGQPLPPAFVLYHAIVPGDGLTTNITARSLLGMYSDIVAAHGGYLDVRFTVSDANAMLILALPVSVPPLAAIPEQRLTWEEVIQ